jgi:branched-chain amino acid transport system permease protein
MFFNEVVRIIWGPQPLFVQVPDVLSGTVDLLGITYPSYRFAIIVVGLVVAVGSWLLIHKTRVGMLIRAGAQNPQLVSALGVNIGLLNALLFGVGAMLAGVAGAMAGPVLSVQSGMGEPVLITTLVVIVIGGIGSVSGAFYAALIVGVVDTLGRVFLPLLLRQLTERSVADAAGPALASMSVYILMAAVLALRPQGLFPAHRG